MTISNAIERLEALKKKYGGDIQIKADCPKCGEVFCPGAIAAVKDTVNAHLQGDGR